MPEMSAYFSKLAATMRAGLADDSAFFSNAPSPTDDLAEACCCDCRQAQVVDAARADMPDPDDCRPDLDALAAMVKEGCRGVIDLDDADWRVVCDELTYQIARALKHNESINLPNLGRLEIVYGDGGPFGRLTLDHEAKP
jgi:hypothetical protein